MRNWIFIPLFTILLIGFIAMSLILVQGLDFVKQITYDFIELIRGR